MVAGGCNEIQSNNGMDKHINEMEVSMQSMNDRGITTAKNES